MSTPAPAGGGRQSAKPKAAAKRSQTRKIGEKKTATKPLRRKRKGPELVVGWREWVGLPALNIDAIRAKVDTGARSSSLHAKNIEIFRQGGENWVRFDVVLDHSHERGRIPCVAPVSDIRSIKNSFGVSEERVIIRTLLRISSGVWPIEVSLADRENMTFPALLGRTAIRNHAVVDPGRSYLCKWVDEGVLPLLPPDKKATPGKKSR
jgi:hypothetical protein